MPSQQRLQRPGFGLPLDHRTGKGFPHAITDYFAITGVTFRERAMLDFVNQITDKPRWCEKLYDEKIVEKWRSECGTEEEQKHVARCLDQKCFDYCIAELRDKAAYYQKHGTISVLDVMASVVKTDSDPSEPFWEALRSGVEPLENVRDNLKDWHPGSDGLVLDLVHPSLFPLEYGKTRVLPNNTVPRDSCAAYAGRGETCPASRLVEEANSSKSLKPWGHYQWLPSDVTFDERGRARIDGYVNNLHPQDHAQLYPVLAKAVDSAVPLWNVCLAVTKEALRIELDRCGFQDFERPEKIEEGDWPDEDWIYDHQDELTVIQPTVKKEYVSPIARETCSSNRPAWIRTIPLHVPDKEIVPMNLIKEYPEGLQVIFKLANIHLTPEKPAYDGSNWHVEGALNERICATALFYYDQENIEDNYLEFRQQIDETEMIMKPGQGEFLAAQYLYGVTQDGPAIQNLGRVLTRPNRALAFPNVLQHRVSPFSLKDPSKPGHRKILALFLVDPHSRILSTSNVPPQRRDWWAREVRKVPPFSALPQEIFEQIVEAVEECPISWEEACEARERLMEERGKVRERIEQEWEEETFSFCEH